jgi:hypothetical protein
VRSRRKSYPTGPWQTINPSTVGKNHKTDSLPHHSDMANIDVEWEVEGILTPQESVEKMLAVITQKTIEDTGTFWTWEGKVRIHLPPLCSAILLFFNVILSCSADGCSFGSSVPINCAYVTTSIDNRQNADTSLVIYSTAKGHSLKAEIVPLSSELRAPPATTAQDTFAFVNPQGCE